MATASYTFSTGVPNINPAVYAANDVGGSDLNNTPTATDSNGVLTLTLDIGDYVAQWSWEGDTHQTTGEVASPNTLGEVAASSGASVPDGVAIVRAFPFAFDTPNLSTGATLYVPTIGDALLDAWLEIETAWDGTTPFGDVGTFTTFNSGWFAALNAPVDMTHAAEAQPGAPSLLSGWNEGADTDLAQLGAVLAAPTGTRFLPATFITADPVKACVSQTGFTNGADPGSTQGAATLYLVTCTPATA